MGAAISTEVSATDLYHNNYLVSFQHHGIKHVDHVSHLLVTGYLRENCRNLPYGIICKCVLFYYNEGDVYHFYNAFDKDYTDESQWTFTKNDTQIQGVKHYQHGYCA